MRLRYALALVLLLCTTSSAQYPEGYCNIVIGLRAGMNLTTGSGNILIGADTGNSVTTENDTILIGNGLDIPRRGVNNYINIGGVEYKSAPDIRRLLHGAVPSLFPYPCNL